VGYEDKKDADGNLLSASEFMARSISKNYHEGFDKNKYLLPQVLTLKKAKQLIEMPENSTSKNFGSSIALDQWGENVFFFYLLNDDRKGLNLAKDFFYTLNFRNI
jgi:hypothetical protein